MILKAQASVETWPLAKPFVIARGTQAAADLIVVAIEFEGGIARGESCPVAHYGETTTSVLLQVEQMLDALRSGADWDEIHDRFSAGAARNAVDCAVWDLRARMSGRPVWDLLGMVPPVAVETVLTIGLDTPDAMATAARAAPSYTNLKLKLGRPGDIARVQAVRRARPDARLVADANEGWDEAMLLENLPQLVAYGVEMLEQPLPVDRDEILSSLDRSILIGADESCHTAADVDRLLGKYDLVNIKLDKTGGLTAALQLQACAGEAGLVTMVGCMLGTSLAMAPAMLVAQGCRYVDLDAPLLIGADRTPALIYDGGSVTPPAPGLWG